MNLFKKYPNRRIYDTQRCCYCTLADIANAVRQGLGVEIKRHISRGVVGPDITRETLMLTLMECESKREIPKLTIEQLRELIRG